MAYKGFSSRWAKCTAAFSARLRKSVVPISKSAVQFLSTASYLFLDEIAEDLPFKTGNLSDSVGVRVMQEYRTVSIAMLPKVATKYQYYKPVGGVTQHIWGRQRLALALGRSSRAYADGVVAQLLVAVPYAQVANEHSGYLIKLYTQFITTMRMASKQLETVKWVV